MSSFVSVFGVRNFRVPVRCSCEFMSKCWFVCVLCIALYSVCSWSWSLSSSSSLLRYNHIHTHTHTSRAPFAQAAHETIRKHTNAHITRNSVRLLSCAKPQARRVRASETENNGEPPRLGHIGQAQARRRLRFTGCDCVRRHSIRQRLCVFVCASAYFISTFIFGVGYLGLERSASACL